MSDDGVSRKLILVHLNLFFEDFEYIFVIVMVMWSHKISIMILPIILQLIICRFFPVSVPETDCTFSRIQGMVLWGFLVLWGAMLRKSSIFQRLAMFCELQQLSVSFDTPSSSAGPAG